MQSGFWLQWITQNSDEDGERSCIVCCSALVNRLLHLVAYGIVILRPNLIDILRLSCLYSLYFTGMTFEKVKVGNFQGFNGFVKLQFTLDICRDCMFVCVCAFFFFLLLFHAHHYVKSSE